LPSALHVQPFGRLEKPEVSHDAVNVSTIGNNSTAIKNYITAQYQSTAGLAYVLLVGDQAQLTSYMSGSAGL